MKNIKKLVSVALLLFSFITPTFAQEPVAPSNGVWVLIDTNYTVGTSVQGVTNTKLTYANTTTSLVTGLQFRVFYDKTAFSSAAVSLIGSTTNLDLQFVDNNANGYVTITVVYTGSDSTYTLPIGNLFNIAFTHVAAGTFDSLPSIGNLTWTGVQTFPQMGADQAGNDLVLSLHNYGGNFLRQTFTYTANFVNVNDTPAKNLPFSLEKKLKTGGPWTLVNNYLTDLNGSYAINEQIDATFYDIRLVVNGGTMDVGNVISVADAQQINQWVLGTGQPSDFDFYAADVNGNNNITISDAYGVFGKISGRFSVWPNGVNNIKFFTSSEYATVMGSPNTNMTSSIAGVTDFTYEIPFGETSITYYVMVTGDANRTGYHMARLTPIEINNPANASSYVIDEKVEYDRPLPTVEINLPSLTVSEGNMVEIPVKTLTGNNKLGSLQLALYYDSNLLEFNEVRNSQKAMSWLSFVNPHDDVIEWGGYDASNNNFVEDGETLFTLYFTAKSPQSEWDSSPLYTSRKFVGNEISSDMNIVPTNGVVEINKIGNQTFITGDMIVYPNPTNGDVFVNFKVDKSGETELCLFDVAGRKVFTIINKYMAKGQYVYSTNLSSLASGLYIAKLNTISKIETDKIAKY
jgi:hypothetical protein